MLTTDLPATLVEEEATSACTGAIVVAEDDAGVVVALPWLAQTSAAAFSDAGNALGHSRVSRRFAGGSWADTDEERTVRAELTSAPELGESSGFDANPALDVMFFKCKTLLLEPMLSEVHEIVLRPHKAL